MKVFGFALSALLLVVCLAVLQYAPPRSKGPASPEIASQAAAVLSGSATSSSATTTSQHASDPTSEATKTPKNPYLKPRNSALSGQIASPDKDLAANYSSPPKTADVIDKEIRGALVNILCMPKNGSLRPVSGSGVVIDPRGIILTNAHVAQYVLLSEDPRVDLECTIRSGSPARATWKAAVLYMPATWAHKHYQELNQDQVADTGEEDYAFLKILGDTKGEAAPFPLPYLPLEARGITMENDAVFVAGYPAELVGGISAQQGLYAAISPSSVQKLLTFGSGTVDELSVGGVIEAQGGSSGGPVVNPWGRIVGLIVTTSAGATTAERDLHTLEINYIDRDLLAHSGKNIQDYFSGDLDTLLDAFTRNIAPAIAQLYISHLSQ